MALTPDAVFLSPPLATADSTADAGLSEGLAALESYKKKDPAKGQSVQRFLCVVAKRRDLTLGSGRALQSRRERAHNETKLLQSHGFQPISSGDPILAQGAWMESGGAPGEYTRPTFFDIRCNFLLPSSRTSILRFPPPPMTRSQISIV
jgi:hypothetical protein